MKILKLSVPILLLFSSCKKTTIAPSTTASTKGYIVVNCDNCKVDYGMPDQYKTFNVVTSSPNAAFNYSAGYSLQVYITALDHEQKLSLSVYNTVGKQVYTNSKTQSLTGDWETVVLLP